MIDDPLYEEVRRAALRAGADRGEVVTISEWVREACREKLERETAGKQLRRRRKA